MSPSPGAIEDLRPSPVPEQAQRVARLALVVVLVALGLWTVRSFLPALVWAAVLSIAVWPLYQRVADRWPGRREILLPALFTTAVALAFILPLLLAAFQAAREAHDVLDWIHGIEASGLPLPEWLPRLPAIGPQAATWWHDNLSQPSGSTELVRRLRSGSMHLLTGEFGVRLAHRLVLFAFTLMTLFFLLRDGPALKRELLTASHKLFGSRGERVARQMVASVHGTVDGLVLVGLGEGLLLGIAYYAAGVPHPVLLGALTAVAAMIPFGAPLVFGIAALLLLAQGSAVAAAVILVLGLVVLTVADHVVRPVLIGGATRLPFLWVLFGILGGVETWGLLGLFLGPAVMAALILLWRELTDQAVAPAQVAQDTRAG